MRPNVECLVVDTPHRRDALGNVVGRPIPRVDVWSELLPGRRVLKSPAAFFSRPVHLVLPILHDAQFWLILEMYGPKGI